MKTPSLEEVKAYFKDAKLVKSMDSGEIFDVSNLEIRNGSIYPRDVYCGEAESKTNRYRLYDDDTKTYAEIISYKDKTDESAKSNQSVKQYKHIPSDYIWNLAKNGKCYRCDEFAGYTIPREIVENSSDWEEVKPKEYVIMSIIGKKNDVWIKKDENSNSFHCGDLFALCDNFGENFKIHSVKRLSDGIVFKVGDKVQRHADKYCQNPAKLIHEITEFYISASGRTFHFQNHNQARGFDLSCFSKVSDVLFTTEDGVEIRKGDKFYYANTHVWNAIKTIANEDSCNYVGVVNNYKTFSNRELAEEYVLMNKPCLSVNDVLGITPINRMLSESICELAKSKING
jgi:hypothetical protein